MLSRHNSFQAFLLILFYAIQLHDFAMQAQMVLFLQLYQIVQPALQILNLQVLFHYQ